MITSQRQTWNISSSGGIKPCYVSCQLLHIVVCNESYSLWEGNIWLEAISGAPWWIPADQNQGLSCRTERSTPRHTLEEIYCLCRGYLSRADVEQYKALKSWLPLEKPSLTLSHLWISQRSCFMHSGTGSHKGLSSPATSSVRLV